MFRTVFGRKQSAAPADHRPPAAAPAAVPANPALRLIAETDPDFPLYSRHLADPTFDDRESARLFSHAATAVLKFDQAERTTMLCAIADAGHLAHFTHMPIASADQMIARRLHALLGTFSYVAQYDATPAAFRAMARLAGTTAVWDSSIYAIMPWQERMKAVTDAGHVPDAAERDWLSALKQKLLIPESRSELKSATRKRAAMIGWIDKVCGSAPDADQRLSTLVTQTTAEGRLPDAPADFAFWLDLIERSAKQLEAIIAERKTGHPAWCDDADAYVRRFPPVEGFWHPFGWRGDGEPTEAGCGTLLYAMDWALSVKHRPTTPAEIQAALGAPAELDKLNIIWSGDFVPRVDRLADPGDPAQAALLLHLAAAKPGVSPTGAWVAKAAKLVGAVGKDAAMARVADWLEQFAGVMPDRANHARYNNYCALVGAAVSLRERRPDLTHEADPDTIARAAASIALRGGVACGTEGYLFCDEFDRIGHAPGRSDTKDRGTAAGGHHSWNPSLSNEAVLRGAIWLTGEMPDAGAVDRLERTVASAVAYSENYAGLRTRGTANAAVAALARIGTPAAREALGRIRRSVPDKAIANAVAKAIATLAATLGVDAADVEEMAVPDYGFD